MPNLDASRTLSRAGLVILMLAAATAPAETGYARPPPGIARLLGAPASPAVIPDGIGRYVLLAHRTRLPPLSDLAQPSISIAGERINPQSNAPALPRRYEALTAVRVATGEHVALPVPGGAAIGWPVWSPDGRLFAFTLTHGHGVELWIGDPARGSVRRAAPAPINAARGPGFSWLPDGRHLLCWLIPPARGAWPAVASTPPGPLVQDTRTDSRAVRIHSPPATGAVDPAIFEHVMTAQLARLDVDSGEVRALGAPAIFDEATPSPDGRFLLVRRTYAPAGLTSTAAPLPGSVELWSASGTPLRVLRTAGAEPQGAVPGHARAFQWSLAEPATVLWFQSDPGNTGAGAPPGDRLLRLPAPFAGPAAALWHTAARIADIEWLSQDGLALVSEYDPLRRLRRAYLLDPTGAQAAPPRRVFEQAVDDRYGDPGSPLGIRNAAAQKRVTVIAGAIYLAGAGAGPAGSRPFLARVPLDALAPERIWQSRADAHEQAVAVIAGTRPGILVRRETAFQSAGYLLEDLATGDRRWLWRADPALSPLAGAEERLLRYQRADGLELSSLLYLPAGRVPGRLLPLVISAYPRSYADDHAASQVTVSLGRHRALEDSLHLAFLSRGYAVMDATSIPVVGPPGSANDRFVEQVVAGAAAALEAARRTGVVDPQRAGVIGHSYGAFLVANLLAHSDLFRAGIAMSGGYDRLVTPFGFQGERRTLWQARDTYLQMSPLLWADRINEPLLLIHGALDDLRATPATQSVRLFEALASQGGTSRLVILPLEGHIYRARESVQHTLAEMLQWFDRHVAGTGADGEADPGTPGQPRPGGVPGD